MTSKTLNSIDSRDCALYYAEWWKRYYNGGFPSKKEIFASFWNGQFYDEEAFYQQAKRGADLLGIRWIKNQKTLYFKTLLLQGGIPIRHISNNKGAYKKFLLKILEVNPESIDDFAFNTIITSLLPPSSRNDEIYECCLAIVKAIINEDKEYLSILDNNQDLNDVSNELRVKKQSLSFSKKRAKFKTSWVFEQEQGQIRLYLGIPQMDSADFRNLMLNSDTDIALDFEYKFFFNNSIICKFVKRADDRYKTIWVNQTDLSWDGTDNFPELYLIDSKSNKHNCQHLVTHLPTLDKPTLWTKYSEAQWILEKGSHTDDREGFILSPGSFTSENQSEYADFNICGRQCKWLTFTNTITLSNQSERYQFKTNSKRIEWFIADDKPGWMKRANLQIVRRNPSVRVFDESGNPIRSVELKWRQQSSTLWSEWDVPIPIGLLEIQIRADDVTEYDKFFNIGTLNVKVTSNSLHKAEITLVGNMFIFSISENDLIAIENDNSDRINLSRTNTKIFPAAVQGHLRMRNQTSGLRFEILPPFEGVEIVDNSRNVVQNNASLSLHNLHHMHLILNQSNLVVNMWNSRRPSILISEVLQEGAVPLRVFEDKINQLYALSDAMDSDAEIIFEIVEERINAQAKIREYRVRRYNQKIEWEFGENDSLCIRTNPVQANLYAVPLDCKNDELILIDLETANGTYVLKKESELEKFIVFARRETNAKIQPIFISLNRQNELTTPLDRSQRILALKDELLKASYSEDVWQRFFSYYKICVNNDLPYSTFDILRAICLSSALAAKSFVFLLCNENAGNFADDAHERLENDLGFSFHWVNRTHWNEAMEWIGCFTNTEVMEIVGPAIKSHFDHQHPSDQFRKISSYLLQSVTPKIPEGYHLNGRINSIRKLLGSKVLSELPRECPTLPKAYQNIISVNEVNSNVKILLRSPVAVALSITGIDESLWNEDNEIKRRNVKYSQQLNPDWYSEAINYCLTKLQRS
jgi:hypothetical protein